MLDSSIIEKFGESLRGDIIQPTDDNYDEARESHEFRWKEECCVQLKGRFIARLYISENSTSQFSEIKGNVSSLIQTNSKG